MTAFARRFVQVALMIVIALSFIWGTVGIGFSPKSFVPVTGIIFLALTVASHWASFYFKNKADDRFEQYEAAADPTLSQQYWDETQRFDLLSEVTLGISYASLAGFIYMVVWK